MKYFFKNNKEPDLCLVFCGWGTDEFLYMPVLKDFDYILYYDYDKELKFKLPVNVEDYKNIYLLAYSAGGIMPAILKEYLPKITLSVAVNASIKLFGKYGLSENFVTVTRNLNSSNYINFRRKYMAETEEELEKFNANQPHRSFVSCFNELDNLEHIAQKYNNVIYDYDRIFSSKNDSILSFDSQKEFFGEKTIQIEGKHFPFYKYYSLKYFFD